MNAETRQGDGRQHSKVRHVGCAVFQKASMAFWYSRDINYLPGTRPPAFWLVLYKVLGAGLYPKEQKRETVYTPSASDDDEECKQTRPV